MNPPEVTFEHFPRGKDDPTPYRARIENAKASVHYGMGATPAEALLNAATHWVRYEENTRRSAEILTKRRDALDGTIG